MSKTVIILLAVVLFVSCMSDNNNSDIISVKVVPCDIKGVDSLMVVTTEGRDLFKIALGGNTELLADTMFNIEGNKMFFFTLADYFQDSQIYYVLYHKATNTLQQTDKLYLPYIGLDISKYSNLVYDHLSEDSLYIKSRSTSSNIYSLAIDTIKVNKNGIINFYEFD